MATPEQSSMPENGYVLDPESATEMARLLLQDRLLNKLLGGLFPEKEMLAGIDRILDIGCGPGGWAVDVACSYPNKKITGIDISEVMLTYAKGQKELHGIENLQFLNMDARHKLQFSAQFFGLVNIRTATAYIARNTWPLLLKECARITQPGGILCVTETDRIGLTNSAAFEKYMHYLTHLIAKMEYGFAVDTYTSGMSPILGKLLQEAGYSDIKMRSSVLDFSYGTKFHPVQRQNVEISFQSLQTPLIEMGIATQEELEGLYESVIQDLGSETFCGIGYIFTFWGKIK